MDIELTEKTLEAIIRDIYPNIEVLDGYKTKNEVVHPCYRVLEDYPGILKGSIIPYECIQNILSDFCNKFNDKLEGFDYVYSEIETSCKDKIRNKILPKTYLKCAGVILHVSEMEKVLIKK